MDDLVGQLQFPLLNTVPIIIHIHREKDILITIILLSHTVSSLRNKLKLIANLKDSKPTSRILCIKDQMFKKANCSIFWLLLSESNRKC